MPVLLFLYDPAMAGKAVIIHSLAHARAALAAAAEFDVPVTLSSAPGAAAYVGPGWFQEVAAQARDAFPEVEATVLIDCGARPGHVLAALRTGFACVRFTGGKAVSERLAAIAEAYGAELVTGRLDALDLRLATEPATACRAWLNDSSIKGGGVS